MSKSGNDGTLQRNVITMEGVPPSIYNQLKNISANVGIPVTSLIKSKLPDIVNSYPEKMRQSPPKN